MELNTQFTYEQIVEIIKQMPEEERQRLKNDVFDINEKIEIEALIMEDFKKYDSVFKALA